MTALHLGLLYGAATLFVMFLGVPIAFGAAQTISFNTEGMMVDGSGNPLNGTVFLMIPKNVGSARAVTVLGSVGRVRGYRWNGMIWTRA